MHVYTCSKKIIKLHNNNIIHKAGNEARFPNVYMYSQLNNKPRVYIVVTDLIILVGCKHRASEVLLYIGGRRLVSQIIEPVTFARL